MVKVRVADDDPVRSIHVGDHHARFRCAGHPIDVCVEVHDELAEDEPERSAA